jgi:hypothetical protein
MKDLQLVISKSENESNIDFTRLFWQTSESNEQLDGNENNTLSAEASCLSKKSLVSSDANNINFCKYDEDVLDNFCHTIELYRNDYSPIKLSQDDNPLSVTDMYTWNEVFNMSSNYLHSQYDDYPVCDYFGLLEKSNY